MISVFPRSQGPRARNYRHGHKSQNGYSLEYTSWLQMIARCENPNNPGYKRYGARGITICARWRTDFVAFLEDMGPRFSRHYSLERIDNAGNYEPSNCRSATVREQANNRRSNRWIEHNGDCRTLAEWARSAGIQGTNPSPEIKQRMADSAGARPSRPQVPARSPAFQTLIGAAVFGRPAPYSLPTIIPGLPP
jgi:hypothetical protein